MSKNVDMARLKQDMAKLLGHPPYDGPTNICRGDGYHALAMERRHGRPLAELKKLAGVLQ